MESTGPASSSKPSKSGPANVPSSGDALTVNSTRNASPVATTIGAEASKVTFPAARAEKTVQMQSAASAAFAIKFLIEILQRDKTPL